MKSLCIKNNNKEIVSYLLEKLSSSNIENLYFSEQKFKIYKNVIVHYKGTDIDFFYDKISSILTECIIYFYEVKLLRRILEYNYFYFSSDEKKQILSSAKDFIEEDTISKEDNYFSIYYSVMDYIKQNKSLILDGFINFRLQNYMKNLDYIIDISVNKFLIEKEYNEFVDILKFYVSITPFQISLIHLVYYKNESILLDNNKKVIRTDDKIFSDKYLPDISFSNNDYVLNTILNLIPKKLIIHMIDSKEDEFINTLKLIFGNRCEICSDCIICDLYKKKRFYHMCGFALQTARIMVIYYLITI